MTTYIRVPFADSGDKDDVPVASATDGSVSFVQGYPIAYSLNPETDTDAKRIERTKMNFIFNQITAAVQEIQQNGVAPYISAADNGGTAYAYGMGAMVMYNGIVYQSLTANNTQLPTVAANWSPLSNQVNSLPVIATAYTGDLNALLSSGVYSVTTATTNSPLAVNGVVVSYVRSGGASVVQEFHSQSAAVASVNRHYVRTATITGGVATWSAWTQTTLRPVELASGQDLNALTESGVYIGGTFTNGPTGIGTAVGFVEVTSASAGAYIKQVLHLAVLNVRYQRTYSASAWSAWKQLVTADDSPGRLLNVQTFTATGTYVPSTGTKKIVVEVLGAGGAGAGGVTTTATQIAGGAGGGGGGYAKSLITAVPSSVAVTVGIGGVGVVTDGGGAAAGGTTSFGTLLQATGGRGGGGTGNTPFTSGSTPASSGGGDGGLGSGGTIDNGKGGVGGRSFFTATNASLAGDGGMSRFSGGPKAAGGTSAEGTDAILGAGGTGGISQAGTTGKRGGSGGNGIVIVWEYS